jgi:hypothetical protein
MSAIATGIKTSTEITTAKGTIRFHVERRNHGIKSSRKILATLTASFFRASNGAEPEVLVRGGAAQQESAEAGRCDGCDDRIYNARQKTKCSVNSRRTNFNGACYHVGYQAKGLT